jgi:predicted phage-related endonuclease
MAGKKTPDTMLSCSRLPAVMGLSKYSTPNDELELSIRALKGEERENKQNESMAWGDRLEAVILVEAAKRLQLADLQTEHTVAMYHDELQLCCSLDGTGDGRGQVIRTDVDAGIFVIGQESITLEGMGVLEAKLTAVSPEDAPALHRGPIQLQGQMDIMQVKWGAVCVLYRGTELRIFLFAPHQQTVDTIAQVTRDFQARLDKFKATGEIDFYPPATSEDADRMFPVAADKVVQLDVEAELLAAKIMDANKRAKDAADDKAAAEKDLKILLGDAKAAVAGKYEIKWPMRSYQAQPQKIVPAKEAYSIRQSTLSVKEVSA